LHDFSTEEMLDGLREGELQIALLKHPSDKPLRGSTFEELDRFAVCVATNRTHRLTRARQVGLHNLAKERFIGYTHAGYSFSVSPCVHLLLLKTRMRLKNSSRKL